jgi:hypothetical protein
MERGMNIIERHTGKAAIAVLTIFTLSAFIVEGIAQWVTQFL